MNRIALSLLCGLLVASVNATPLAASPTWNLANPSTVVAYQVGSGVITIASTNLLTCQKSALLLTAKYVYDYKVESPGKGILCMAQSSAQIAAYYQPGSPTTIKVNTKDGTVTITVTAAPPAQPSIGHMPFH